MENLKSLNREIIDISLIQNLSNQELASIAKNLSVQELKPIMIIEKYYEDSALYSFYSKTLTYTDIEDLLVDSSPEARRKIEDFFIYCLKNYKLFWLRKNILDKNYETLNELQGLENINDINYNFADGKTKKIISLGLNPLNMDFGSGVSSWFNGSGTEITVINKNQNQTLIETIYSENLISKSKIITII